MRQNVPIRGNSAFQAPWVEKLREGQFGQYGMRGDWEDEAGDGQGLVDPLMILVTKL